MARPLYLVLIDVWRERRAASLLRGVRSATFGLVSFAGYGIRIFASRQARGTQADADNQQTRRAVGGGLVAAARGETFLVLVSIFAGSRLNNNGEHIDGGDQYALMTNNIIAVKST